MSLRPVLALALVLATALFAARLTASELDLTAVPADCRWALQVDAKPLLAGRLGGWLRQEAQQPEHAAGLQFITQLTGCDPFTDVERVVICGSDQDENHHLIIAKGRWNAEQLASVIVNAKGYRALQHQGVTLHRWLDEKKNDREQFGWVLGDRLAIGNTENRLRASLDVFKGKAGARLPSPNAPTGALVASVAVEDLAKLQEGKNDPGARLLAQARTATLAVAEEGELFALRMDLIAKDANTAQQMQQLVQGLVALGNLQAGGDPKHGHPMPPAAKELLRNVQVRQEGPSVVVTSSVAAQAVIDLLEAKKKAERHSLLTPAETAGAKDL